MTAMTHASETRLNPLRRKRLRRALAAEANAGVRADPRARRIAQSIFAALFVGIAGLAWHRDAQSVLSPADRLFEDASVNRLERLSTAPKSSTAMPRKFRAAPQSTHLLATCSTTALLLGAATANRANANSPTPIHAYDFTSGVTDLAGSADGQLLGGAITVGGVLATDGINDYVQFPVRLIPTTGPFTVALRFKTLTVPTTWMELISQGCSECGSFYLGRAINGQWRYWHDNVSIPTGVEYPTDGAWHHVAVSYTPGELSRLFVDGVHVATVSSPPLSTAGSNTRLARQFAPGDEFHHGLIDDLFIYDTALTATDIARLADTCPGDIDENSIIDGVDLAIVLGRWGTNPKDYPRADTNGDGTVDGADLAQVLGTWGACP